MTAIEPGAHVEFMARALVLAATAAEVGEVPVGAVLVMRDSIIGEGHNAPVGMHDPSAHAEIMALRAAGQCERNYRLPGSVLYTTLEPCVMCAGAIVHARVERLVFAAHDPRAGAVESVFRVLDSPTVNHRVEYTGGILADQASDMLREFFRARR